jgi:hypothetical protein
MYFSIHRARKNETPKVFKHKKGFNHALLRHTLVLDLVLHLLKLHINLVFKQSETNDAVPNS